MHLPGHEVRPQAEQESVLRHFLLGRLDFEVYLVFLDCFLRATTKKGRQLFLRKKVHPRQNPGYAYAKTSADATDNR